MTVSPEVVRQEVSELHRFIEPLVTYCTEIRADYPVYSKTSRDFFKHIGELGQKSLSYLESLPEQILQGKYPQIAASKRQKLLQLRTDWERLHEYIRPALDADTLHLPMPLISALHDRLHETKKWYSYEFTLFHAAEVNYFEVPPSIVRRAADGIAWQIGGKTFPKTLGLIGIPYSQADGIFLNCSLAHEMGHFIFQEDEDAFTLAQEKIDDAVERMVSDSKPLAYEKLTLCRELISNWTEETFCDLFAICLIGPAFSFAFSQLLSASILIESAAGQPEDFYLYGQYHPACVARFRVHQRLLEKLGWWKEIQGWTSAPVQVLRLCASSTSQFKVQAKLGQDLKTKLLSCYEELCAWLIEYVPSRVKRQVDDVANFRDQSLIITQYLQRAIVPSTIIVNGQVVHPRPVVLINAGYRFLLEEFPLLLTNIKRVKPNSIKSRSKFSARLELWLLKALEDHRLLTGGT